ncbi:DUF4262 domain-containing protein [Kitasatospora sp. NPDC101183]|uniref:DUF4262 domain-containing protein n=1 Tax=Kitasatospora sp. NPDC101183 TaxID=3364100 RepID=UPI00382139E3
MNQSSPAPCPCVICDPAASATLRARWALRRAWGKETAHVREYGWHVVGVGGGGEVPDWAFSVGLWHSYRLPEIAMVGLETEDTMRWINTAAALLRDGAPSAPGTLLEGVIDDYEVTCQPVDDSWYLPLFGTAAGFYRREPVPFVQLVWPDREHRWPEDPAASPGCRAQPRLHLPVADHPRGVWTEEAAAAQAP